MILDLEREREMGGGLRVLYAILVSAVMLLNAQQGINAALTAKTHRIIRKANREGPYLGLVIPNLFEMNPLLLSPNFTSANLTIDFAGNYFYCYSKQILRTYLPKCSSSYSLYIYIFLSFFQIKEGDFGLEALLKSKSS